MNEAQSPAGERSERNDETSSRKTVLLLVTGALLLTFGWMLAGGASVQAKTDPKMGTTAKAADVNGQTITMADVEAKAADKLEDLDLQHQQMEAKFDQERVTTLKSTLDEMVDDRLLTMEAQATGKTKEALLAEKAKAPDVSDADVDAFYAQLQAQRPQGLPPKDQIATQIKAHLSQQGQQKAHDDYMKELRGKYKVATYIEEPRIKVATEGQPAKGPANAPVTIVEFSDFQCPFCGRVEPTIAQIEQKYGSQIRLVFRQFPLVSIHPMAQKAAEASLCANEQGKFWEMHDAMFADQEKLLVPDLKAKAGKLGLDQAKFDQCLDSGKFVQRIKDDTKAGTIAGVNGTPAFFINGRSLSGAQPYEALASVIDEELAKSKTGSKG